MKPELLLQNRAGRVFEISKITEKVEYTTNRTGSAGKLTFSLIKAGDLSFHEGDRVRFSVDGTLIFFGYVFTKVKDRWGVIAVTCYDQLRFLKTNVSYVFTGKTAGQIIQQIANDFNEFTTDTRLIKVGRIDDTGYAIPSLVQENRSCLDIINHAVQLTTRNTGKVFAFFDDGGELSLRKVEDMRSTTVIGTKSLLTEYEYKTDIDRETYNQIKLVRPNKESGRADTYIVKDSANIERWGLLQLYKTVDEQLNEAQITAQAETMLAYYNRVLRTLTIQSLGVPGIRAGSMVMINVPDLGDISLSKYVLLEKVVHIYANESHTMEVETLTIPA